MKIVKKLSLERTRLTKYGGGQRREGWRIGITTMRKKRGQSNCGKRGGMRKPKSAEKGDGTIAS